MDKNTLTVIICFTLFGLVLILRGLLRFKRNFISGMLSCVAGSIFVIGINLMAMVP